MQVKHLCEYARVFAFSLSQISAGEASEFLLIFPGLNTYSFAAAQFDTLKDVQTLCLQIICKRESTVLNNTNRTK